MLRKREETIPYVVALLAPEGVYLYYQHLCLQSIFQILCQCSNPCLGKLLNKTITATRQQYILPMPGRLDARPFLDLSGNVGF